MRVDVVSSTCAPQQCGILFSMEHIFTDGVSVCQLFHEFLHLVATYDVDRGDVAATLSPLPWSAPVEVVCASRSFAHLAWRWLQFLKGGAPKPARILLPEYVDCSLDELVDNYTTDGEAMAELSVQDTAALLGACRARGTTLTGALLAAIAEAVKAVQPVASPAGSCVSLGIAVDTRKRVRPQIPRSLLAAHFSAMLAVDPPLSAECVHRWRTLLRRRMKLRLVCVCVLFCITFAAPQCCLNRSSCGDQPFFGGVRWKAFLSARYP